MSKYLRNENYFDVIDTYAKAYIVGFIAADGSIVKSSRGNSYYLTITIKYEDKAILDFIKQELGSLHKLTEINKIGVFGKPIHHIRLSIGNSNLIRGLNQIGLHPNKSLTIGNLIDNMPQQYKGAFIIGYLDGDGSVTRVSNSPNNKSLNIQIRGTREFLKGITSTLEMPDTYISQYDSIPQLSITHKKYQRILFSYYENLPFYYTRKYNKFLGYL